MAATSARGLLPHAPLMRWKGTVGVAVLLVAAIGGGLAFYTYYQVKTGIDDLATSMSPVAELRYARLWITPRGTVRIQDVQVRPRAVDDPLRIEGVEVETPGLWFLLTGPKNLRNGQLPEHLRATFRGVAFNLHGPMAKTLDRLLAAAAQSSGAPPVSNCGETRYFDFGAYQRLGYQSLVFDLSLGYRFARGAGPLRVTMDGRTRQLGSTTVTLEFVGVSPNLRDNAAMGAALRTFDVVYQDQSFTERLKGYCARASGMTVQQYIESEVARSAAAYGAQWGLVPGPGLREAYRQFLIKPGEVRVQGTPAADLNMARLRRFTPAEIVSKLNLRVSVNGKVVTDLSMTPTRAAPPLPSPSSTAALPPSPGPVAALPPPPAPATPAPPSTAAAVTSEFRLVPTTGLGGHLDKTVRVHLTDGTTREGRLLQVAQGMARVERRLRGGVITHGIPLREIDRVEVRF